MLSPVARLLPPDNGELNPRQLNWCLGLLLLIVAIRGVLSPYDVAAMMTADATYGIHMLEVPLLEFRPPPPNRLFPDVMLHALIRPLGLDLVSQKIIVGVAIFIVTAWLIGMYKGIGVLVAYLAITTCAGFGFLNSVEHYSLPLTFLLYQLAGRRALRAVLLFVAVFCDLLIVLPLIVYLFEKAAPADRRWIVALAIAAMIAAILYAELAAILVPFAAILPVVTFVAWWASRRGVLMSLCAVVGAVLLVVALTGHHARYSLPMLGVLLLIYTPTTVPRINWRAFAAPVAIVLVFLVTHERRLNNGLDSEMRCLADTLQQQGIDNVAVEYWTARPLHFELVRRGRALTLTVVDFNDGDTDPFMAPYAFYGAPTFWGILNHHTCVNVDSHSKHCAQALVAEVISRQQVCNSFELFRYATPIPPRFEGRPAGKLPSLRRNFLNYVRETRERLAAL
jgi:hypothetical protein